MTDGTHHIDPGDPPAELGPNQVIMVVEAEASAEVVQTDRLNKAFLIQRNAQVNVHGFDLDNMTDEERIDFIHWNVTALVDELHEALGEVGWKPWATSRHINRDAFVGELVDAYHFFMNLGLVVGLTGDELWDKYIEKRQLNDARQAGGYDGVSTKCPGCGRALDDPATQCRLVDLDEDRIIIPGAVAWCQNKDFVREDGTPA